MNETQFKHLTEYNLKHYLNEALNNCLKKEQIKINDENLYQNIGLEHEYYKLLNMFEEHIKDIIKANKMGYKE